MTLKKNKEVVISKVTLQELILTQPQQILHLMSLACVLYVPVKVSYAGSKKQMSTYFNNCSQGCFMKDSFRKNFGEDGRKTEITIKTLNGEQRMKSTVISVLKVRSDSDEDNKR